MQQVVERLVAVIKRSFFPFIYLMIVGLTALRSFSLIVNQEEGDKVGGYVDPLWFDILMFVFMTASHSFPFLLVIGFIHIFYRLNKRVEIQLWKKNS